MKRGEKTLIPCRHCGVEYTGTVRALKRLRQEGRGGYCSEICKRAAIEGRKVKPKLYGPCPTCAEMFNSMRPKIYCSMKCYTSSAAFAETQKIATRRALEVQGLSASSMVPCIECGSEFLAKPSGNRKYCSSNCYRSYAAKRFDRWVANPEGIAIEQSYDEFLTQDELECPIAGCDWRGQNLSLHMNFGHGVPKAEFKRAAGFNLSTGVITPALRETFSAREGSGDPAIARFAGSTRGNSGGYSSKEGAEHRLKGRAMAVASRPPRDGVCPVCSTGFDKPALGHKTYCSVDCRTQARASRLKAG